MRYWLYNALEAFVKINILVATLFIIGTNSTASTSYVFFLGILGIVWVIFPVVTLFIEEMNE